jgi:FRG domain
MESILIRSWLELAQLLELHADGTWLFRGESTDGDPLKPAADRVGREIGSARKKPYEKAHEIEALEQFKREARPHLTHLPENDLEWLAIAQHHGMATRLLDWSESLLVAAFFEPRLSASISPAVYSSGCSWRGRTAAPGS